MPRTLNETKGYAAIFLKNSSALRQAQWPKVEDPDPLMSSAGGGGAKRRRWCLAGDE